MDDQTNICCPSTSWAGSSELGGETTARARSRSSTAVVVASAEPAGSSEPPSELLEQADNVKAVATRRAPGRSARERVDKWDMDSELPRTIRIPADPTSHYAPPVDPLHQVDHASPARVNRLPSPNFLEFCRCGIIVRSSSRDPRGSMGNRLPRDHVCATMVTDGGATRRPPHTSALGTSAVGGQPDQPTQIP